MGQLTTKRQLRAARIAQAVLSLETKRALNQPSQIKESDTYSDPCPKRDFHQYHPPELRLPCYNFN